jgi:hypothetical protein
MSLRCSASKVATHIQSTEFAEVERGNYYHPGHDYAYITRRDVSNQGDREFYPDLYVTIARPDSSRTR